MLRYQNYPRQQELKKKVWDFASRTAEWDKREQEKNPAAREKSHVTA
jgi:CCR4-NOT transcriptional regulation complex NOT5 subunit